MPNAGKSSLFTALTGVAAEAANYPFTTIEPNVAIVPVADERLDAVAEMVGASKIVPDTIAFHDIAGLVAGAHRGEGLGNQFLANIRETDAIVHVVRAHEDRERGPPRGPGRSAGRHRDDRDRADLRRPGAGRAPPASAWPSTAKAGDRHAVAEAAWLERADRGAAGRPARAHRAAARRRARRHGAAAAADRQAGAVRRQRRRGVRRGPAGDRRARRAPSAPARSRCRRGSRPSWASCRRGRRRDARGPRPGRVQPADGRPRRLLAA